jgi:hypothetical protein
MQSSGSTLVARLLPRRVRRGITFICAVVWIATIYALVRGHDGPRWLELLWVITSGLYIAIDRVARWAEAHTGPEEA